MKNTILTLTLIGLVWILTACGGSSSEATPEGVDGNAVSEGERQFNMPTEMQLMLGTVKLDETEYAVDAEQASLLLPLWKALRSLSESDTVAQVEMDALVTQLEETMTPDQIKAIEAMDLSMQDTSNVMEALGIEGNLGGFGAMDPEMQETMGAARESGEFPAGGPGGGMGPAGGMGPGGGEFSGAEIDPAARATAMAERGGNRGGGSAINTVLLDAIIEFLEAKIQ